VPFSSQSGSRTQSQHKKQRGFGNEEDLVPRSNGLGSEHMQNSPETHKQGAGSYHGGRVREFEFRESLNRPHREPQLVGPPKEITESMVTRLRN